MLIYLILIGAFGLELYRNVYPDNYEKILNKIVVKYNVLKCQLEKNVVGFIPDFPGFSFGMMQYELTKNAEMDELRAWIGIDSITGYKFTTIAEIKDGTLKGNLSPLMNKERIPDMKKIWIGDFDPSQNEIYYGVSSC